MQDINNSALNERLIAEEVEGEADSEILLNVPNEPSAGLVGV